MLEKDPKKQLEYYYQGRNKANDDEIFLHLNAIIVKKEQEKINAAFKKLKVYSEKPEWTKVIEDSEYGTEDYWIERQDEFFENTNKCVYNYSDNQLAKCFEAVNNKQIRLNNELEDDIKDQMLFDYQEKIISQNNKIIRQQRYNNYIQSLQYHELLQINNNINKDIEINFW